MVSMADVAAKRLRCRLPSRTRRLRAKTNRFDGRARARGGARETCSSPCRRRVPAAVNPLLTFASKSSDGGLLGQAEIQQFHHISIADEDVGRLDVAVHDPLFVSGVERIGDLDGEIDDVDRLERRSSHALRQRPALQQFHRNERNARRTRRPDKPCRCEDGSAKRRSAPHARIGEARGIGRQRLRR